MAAPKARDLQSERTCSVCLELVNGTHERSIAKLICGHTFHLDCIGSAFNAKGSMQCPNCRRIEHGDWLYGNGHPHHENSMPDDMILEEYDVELEMLARVSDLFVPDNIWQCRWFPYQEIHTQLEFSLGNENHPPTPYTELVVGVLVDENSESTRSVQPSPYARAQAPVLDRRERGVEGSVGVAVASSAAHMHHGAAYQQHFSPVEQRGRRRQSPAALEPNGVPGGVGVEEGLAGHSWHSQSRHDGIRRRLSASASEFLPRPESWHHASPTSAVQEPVREAQPRSNPSFGHRRQRARTSRFGGLNPSEPEGQRLAPSPPSLGLFGTHGIPALHAQAPSHARRLYSSTEEIDVHASRSFHHPSYN